ncbi:MAG: gas vesicle protein [Actinomycetota bacterium]|nr:gas vesicle protein [Actinomycetota bacterium]
MAQQQQGRGGPSGLADVLEVLLDKGLVIDAFVRVSLVGIELLTIDARVVVASVDTYLRFAEAVNRLDLLRADNSQNLGDLVGGLKKKPAAGEDDRPALETPEPTGSQERDEPAHDEDAPSGEDEQSRQKDDEDDKGLIGRLRERGQVF